jgi:class 3 adenylate cyclase
MHLDVRVRVGVNIGTVVELNMVARRIGVALS